MPEEGVYYKTHFGKQLRCLVDIQGKCLTPINTGLSIDRSCMQSRKDAKKAIFAGIDSLTTEAFTLRLYHWIATGRAHDTGRPVFG